MTAKVHYTNFQQNVASTSSQRTKYETRDSHNRIIPVSGNDLFTNAAGTAEAGAVSRASIAHEVLLLLHTKFTASTAM